MEEYEKNVNNVDTDDGGGGFLAIFALVVLAFLVLMIIVANNSASTMLALNPETAARAGQQTTFTVDEGDFEIADGESYQWFVDDIKMGDGIYHEGDDITVKVTPSQTGNGNVTIKGEKWTASHDYYAEKPLLNVEIPFVEIIYGDDVPDFELNVTGYVGNDATQNPFKGKAYVDGDTFDVGTYRINVDNTDYNDKYEVRSTQGTLCVVPKTLTIKSTSIVKTYDGDKAANASLMLEGVEQGDDVTLGGELYFCDKCAGINKVLFTDALTLIGEDAKNYKLSDDELLGTIMKKRLTLDGTAVSDKRYDGTKSAYITETGNLVGIVEGDSVAIGSLNAEYDSPLVGNAKSVRFVSWELVGSDKDNYSLAPVAMKGNIVYNQVEND